MRNLPLVFGLVLAGGLLIEHGAKLFGSTLGGLGGGDSPPSPDDPAAHAADAGVHAGGIGAVSGSLLSSEASKYRWSSGEISAWIELLGLESSGNPQALGPTVATAAPVPNVPGGGKRAWGVGQFLGSTLRDYLPYGAGSSAVGPQLTAMGRYIHDRYGSPSEALAFHKTHNWY